MQQDKTEDSPPYWYWQKSCTAGKLQFSFFLFDTVASNGYVTVGGVEYNGPYVTPTTYMDAPSNSVEIRYYTQGSDNASGVGMYLRCYCL